MFFRNISATTGAVFEKEAVERIATRIMRDEGLLSGDITLNVAATENDLPGVIRKQAEKDNATGEIKGVLHIVTDQIQSENDVDSIAAHEALNRGANEKNTVHLEHGQPNQTTVKRSSNRSVCTELDQEPSSDQ